MLPRNPVQASLGGAANFQHSFIRNLQRYFAEAVENAWLQ